jgi:hypothetical protein
MAHLVLKNASTFLARSGQTALPTARPIPVLSLTDRQALESIRTNEAFTLEKSLGMYAGTVRLRPKK